MCTCRSYSAPTNGVISDEPSYLDFSTDDEYCGDLTAATYWNTYFTPNNSMRTGDLPLEEIETMVAEITRSNSSTATISINAAPTLPRGEVRRQSQVLLPVRHHSCCPGPAAKT